MKIKSPEKVANMNEEHEQSPERFPLGQMLKEAGFMSQRQVDEALAEATTTGERLGEVVVRRGWASEEDVAILLAEQWGLDYVASGGIWFEGDALQRLSREEARRIEALPTRIEDGHVVVAVAEPTEERLADLRRMVGDDTVVVVVPKSALQTGLQSELLVDEADVAERGTVVQLPTPTEEGGPMELEATLHRAAAETTAPAESAAALAAQVRGVADAIASLAEYEERVGQLEAELEARQAATRELRDVLARAVSLLDES